MHLYDMKASAGIAYLDQDGRGVAEKFENIEPIPLTTEILEKNGYYHNSTDYYVGIIYGKSLVLDMCFEGSLIYDGKLITPCQYVHKFQHLLKDLEIDKEIVL